MKYRKLILYALVAIAITAIIIDNVFISKKTGGLTKNSELRNAQYVGDLSCKSCHQREYSLWQTSDHFKAMQIPTDSTVKGNFNNATYTADGVNSRFYKKGNKFFINTQGEDGKNHDYEIAYTFGHYPLQQYLIKFPGGKYQATRTSWDAKNKKWFHQYKGDKIPAGDWLHWTGSAQNWNTNCADCHSTNLQKNYFVEKDSFNTTYSSINVSCEACHGAASNHIEYINGAFKTGNKETGSRLQLPKNSSQVAQIVACAPCHARRTMLNKNLIHSNELLDNYIPEIPSGESFHDDGQVKDEDFIYTSFVQSKMYAAGVRCNNCHNPHSGKLVLNANNVCQQCHQKKYNEPEHTFHAANSTGSQCVNCHMPGDYFMGNDYRHDHAMRVPRPDLSVAYGTTNACNNCHKDKSAKWAAKAIDKWYGKTRAYHFTEDLIPGSRGGAAAETHLLKLLNKPNVPQIVKAAAVNYLGNVQTNTGLNAIIGCLASKDAQVKYRALMALKNYDQQQWISYTVPLLQDDVRAVRVAAADLFLTVPIADIPSNYQSSFSRAKDEHLQYLYYQADFSVGNLSLADYYARLADCPNAEKFYLRALKKDNLMNLARLNLSIAYSLDHKNNDALAVLKDAEKIDPKNENVLFNMALLYNEVGDKTDALQTFEKGVKMNAKNPRFYYNYGLLLLDTDEFKAEQILKKGLLVEQDNIDLHYALAFLYLRQKQPSKAMSHALILKKLSPNNPNYAQIFSALKL